MLVCPSISWRWSAHLPTTIASFFDSLIKLPDNYIVFSVSTVSDQVLPFHHKAFPFTRTSTADSCSNFVFNRRFLLPSEVVDVNVAIWGSKDCSLRSVAGLNLGSVFICNRHAWLGLEGVLPGVVRLQGIPEVIHLTPLFISGLVVAHHGLQLLQLRSLFSELISFLPVYLLFEHQVVFPNLVVTTLEFISALHCSFDLWF